MAKFSIPSGPGSKPVGQGFKLRLGYHERVITDSEQYSVALATICSKIS